MKLKKLTKPKHFESLKNGDFIIVMWDNYFVKHHEQTEHIMGYNIYENKLRSDEIICRLKGNHFFNWKMYLGLDIIGANTSYAREVYKVKKWKF